MPTLTLNGVNIDLLAFLICDSVIQDATTGKTSIQGVFDTVFAPQVPAVHPQLAVFFRLLVDDPTAQITPSLAFADPMGLRNVMPNIPPLNLGPVGLADAIINLQGLHFSQWGRYRLELLINGIVVARHPITMQQLGVPIGGSKQLH